MTPAEPCAAPSGGTHAWVRLVTGWHVGFWGVTALAAAWAALSPDLREGRTRVLVLLAVLAVTYLATVQRDLIGRPGPARVYLAVAVTTTGLALAAHPAFTMLLFLVYAQCWVLGRSRLEGTAWSVALTLAALAGFLQLAGWSVQVATEVAPELAVSLAFSVLLGFWISRIIDQSAERADLIGELEKARAELAAAERARGVADERERLAREIHDTLAQGFTSIVMLAQAAVPALERDPAAARRHLGLIEEVARDNLDEARALVAASAPAGLDGSTLPDAVRRLAERFGRETGIEVETDVAPVAHLDRDRQVVVLRAVQEALSNVRRHAGAGRVAVRLVEDGDGALVEVGDDGAGFAPADRHRGYGLDGMRARVGEVGGELDVASTPGGGTLVTVRLPAVGP